MERIEEIQAAVEEYGKRSLARTVASSRRSRGVSRLDNFRGIIFRF
jgi:hypothetical protein